MAEMDRDLVARFVRHGDGEAFSTIMTRYADMVYGTCRRVLGNDAQAADAAQETFFHFLKDANRITGSVGSWLHQVATRRALDLVRQDTARRHREQTYALEQSRPGSWTEVEPLVDEALEELPDPLRELLVLHFLERRSMTQIAASKGVSQPTVSRRVAEALEQLRDKLRQRGVLVRSVPLQAVLLHDAPLAPEALLRALNKMGLAHAASATASGATVVISTKTVAVAAAVVLGLGAGWFTMYKATPARPSSATKPMLTKANVPSAAAESAKAGAKQSSDNATINAAVEAPAVGARPVVSLARAMPTALPPVIRTNREPTNAVPREIRPNGFPTRDAVGPERPWIVAMPANRVAQPLASTRAAPLSLRSGPRYVDPMDGGSSQIRVFENELAKQNRIGLPRSSVTYSQPVAPSPPIGFRGKAIPPASDKSRNDRRGRL